MMSRWNADNKKISDEKRQVITKWEKKIATILQMRAENLKNETRNKEEELFIERLAKHNSPVFLEKVINILKTNKSK